MDQDGGNPVNLTKNPASDTMPRWSADAKQIIFATDRDGNPEIYVMGVDGANPANLSRSPAAETYPTWK
jgi:TolB protein